MDIYENNYKHLTLKDLKDGEVFHFYSDYTRNRFEDKPPLYMKVCNTTHSLDECGIVNLKTGYVSQGKEDAIVMKIKAVINVI